jgi:hypothetical protein
MDTMLTASGDPLPEPLAARVRAALQPGEVLLWTGRPIPALAARPAMAFSLISGVMFVPAVFVALFMVGMVLLMVFLTKLVCFALVLVPVGLILLLSITLIVGVPLWTRSLAAGTAYALTDRRAIVWQKGPFSVSVQSFTRDRLGNLQRRERPDGSGDLIFDQTYFHDHNGHHHARAVGFMSIARVREIEDLVRALVEKAQEQDLAS